MYVKQSISLSLGIALALGTFGWLLVATSKNANTAAITPLPVTESAADTDVAAGSEALASVMSTQKIWTVFSEPNEDEALRLNEWLQNEFLANMEDAEHHLRSRIVAINTVELRRNAQTSIESSATADQVAATDADFILELFPDAAYEARVSIYKEARNSTVVTIHGSLVGDEFSGRESVYLTITVDGRLRGSLLTNDRAFRIAPGPTLTSSVVIEFDSDGLRKSKRID